MISLYRSLYKEHALADHQTQILDMRKSKGLDTYHNSLRNVVLKLAQESRMTTSWNHICTSPNLITFWNPI